MSKKAIAYTSDVILGRTGDVVSRKEQRAAIEQHARENDIQIVAWFEDEVYVPELLDRPGVKAMLACDDACDCVLVERVHCLSGKWPELHSFLDLLERRSVKLESTSLRWDCVSQMARFHPRRLGESTARLNPRVAAEPVKGMAPKTVLIARPQVLRFSTLRS
ncbi:MAG: recombinase family protein [Polyangia bacterium]|jgi:DNA invertase Pin-like site-specific DNA recombinase|nr:recombinase family protein [Polyangia bacterium]